MGTRFWQVNRVLLFERTRDDGAVVRSWIRERQHREDQV